FWINFFDSDMGTGYIRGNHVRWADGTPMAWTNWAESEPRLTGSGACGTANGTSLQWGTDDCTGGRHGFMCQSWGNNGRPGLVAVVDGSCHSSKRGRSCIWDAEYHEQTWKNCEQECGRDPRCWAFIHGQHGTNKEFQMPAQFQSRLVRGNSTGCVAIIADTLSLCTPVNATYLFHTNWLPCFTYELVTPGSPSTLPPTPDTTTDHVTTADVYYGDKESTEGVTTTQMPPEVTVESSRTCLCWRDHNISLQQAMQDARKLQTALAVPKATLSATRRKKESAPDPRDSARYTGYVGVAAIFAVFSLIVISDLLDLIFHITRS
ncbi:hypothetical protein BaRGS_00013615, partial [Batillaria attramentaria]